jgi:hypothetical protein
MTYSMKLYPNEQSEFPPPPPWLVWCQEHQWNYSNRSHVLLETGQVRHHDTLAVAKKNIGRADGEGKFYADWALYEWDAVAKRYDLRYEGKRGDLRKDHPLWARGAVPKTKAFREVSDEDMAKVLASLEGVL